MAELGRASRDSSRTIPGLGPAPAERDGLYDWLIATLSSVAGGLVIEIDTSTPLLEGGVGLDSLGMLELITAIESRLRITIDEREIVPEHFATVGALLAFLESRRHRHDAKKGS